MALKPCKECGAEISTVAKACPKCGAPSTLQSIQSLGCVITIIGILIVVALVLFICSRINLS